MSATSRFPFARLMTASGLSNLADGVLKTAVPLVALRYTTSPALIAGLSFAMTLPWLVAALPAGALVDRWDRRATMLVANSVRAVVLVLVVLVAGTGHGSIWLLYAGGVLVGVAEVFNDTSAQSVLPMVVGREALQKANGRLFALETTTNSFAGPPIGGVVASAGIAVALGAPAAMWVLAVLVLLTLRGTFRVGRAAERTSLRADVGEGLRFLWSRPLLRTLAIMVGAMNLASAAWGAVFVLWAVGPTSALHLTSAQYGVLLTTFAVGSVAGSLVADRLAALMGRTASLVVAVAASALMPAGPLLTTNVWLLGALWVVASFMVATWNVITVSLRQRLTPDRLLGRLNSAYRLLAWGTMPLGAAIGGALGEAFGVRSVFVVGTVLALALLTLSGQLTPARLAAAEAQVIPDLAPDEPTAELLADDEPGSRPAP
ncbi:MAG TPA: MFS transporter [Cellulomonas sp.]